MADCAAADNVGASVAGCTETFYSIVRCDPGGRDGHRNRTEAFWFAARAAGGRAAAVAAETRQRSGQPAQNRFGLFRHAEVQTASARLESAHPPDRPQAAADHQVGE